MIIEKKIWPKYFEAIKQGRKKFELRLADFKIKEGDILVLKEWNPKKKKYTGRKIKRKVKYLLKYKLGDFWPKKEVENTDFMLFKFKKILIASRNPAKLSDYRKAFNGLAFKIVSLDDLNINQDLKENGNSLKENAIKKVEFYGKITDLPTIGDDSGLEIDYLNGEPGVKSRRWPGYEATDQELIELVLKKLEGVPWKKRRAQLRAVVAIFLPQKGTFTFEAKTKGFILEKPVGELIPGYPFRSIFYVSKYRKPFTLLSPAEEEKISHRKRVLRKLMKFLEKFYEFEK